MLNIGICDDEQFFLEDIEKNLKQIFKKHQWKASISSFCSGQQLIAYNESQKFDIIFLDIDMPDISGFTIAKNIQEKDTLLVFCTNHNEMVYNSFTYQPFWFLCKDNYKKNLEEVLIAARKKMALKNFRYEFNISGEIHTVAIDEIIYFDVLKHRVHVHLSRGNQIDFRDNLSKIEEIFQDYGFVKVNSGCLINMLWIKHIYQSDVELKDGQVFSLSRGRKNNVREKFHNYMRLKK